MDVYEVLKWGFIVVNTFGLAHAAFRDRRWIRAYRQMNWLLLIGQVVSLPIILPLLVWFSRLHPIMGLSWLNLFGKEGANFNIIGWDIKYFGVVILLLIMMNLPGLAAWEEDIFRKGTKNWLDAMVRSVVFGFMHMLVGAPVYGALFLTITGIFYTLMYFVGGTELSTKAHFQFNFLLVTILLFVSVLG